MEHRCWLAKGGTQSIHPSRSFAGVTSTVPSFTSMSRRLKRRESKLALTMRTQSFQSTSRRFVPASRRRHGNGCVDDRHSAFEDPACMHACTGGCWETGASGRSSQCRASSHVLMVTGCVIVACANVGFTVADTASETSWIDVPCVPRKRNASGKVCCRSSSQKLVPEVSGVT